jgi:serine/threonine protein kinase
VIRGRKIIPTDTKTDEAHFIDLVKKMLTIDPDERVRPQEAMSHPFFNKFNHPKVHS